MSKITKSDHPYIIVKSESCDYYLIPAAEKDKFHQWDDAMCNDEETELDFNDYALGGSLNLLHIYSWKDV